jgi:hypothetical protein
MEPQNIQIAPEIIQAITREATARGLSVDEYLRQALGVMNGTSSPDSQASARPFYETATIEEWVSEYTKWAESHGPNTPGLTREDVRRLNQNARPY